MENKLKAILIDCIPPSVNATEAEYRLLEAENLTKTYGGVVLVKKIQKKLVPDYGTYIGKGKIEEIIEEGKRLKANIVIVNNELKPRQTYNLSELFRPHNLEVWDRIDLILKIFAKHAQTREAKLEIELASIRHMGPRIFGMGMQLSRQGGGIGTRGVGETNIEFMKRHLYKMECRIKKDLEACKNVRRLHRSSRQRRNLPTVGIIGYTNAGKSSLLNALTKKGAYTADKLFATLDTRVGKMYLFSGGANGAASGRPFKMEFFQGSEKNATEPYDQYGKRAFFEADAGKNHFQRPPKEVLVSDTIGFIQDLPPALVKSFQSTLEETIEADLLLHVIDISDPKMLHKMEVVNEILGQINAFHKPCIYVFNKTDLLTPEELEHSTQNLSAQFKKYHPCFISTINKTGIEDLKQTIFNHL